MSRMGRMNRTRRVSDWLRAAAGRQDIVLAALLLVTVLMIIIPMPPSVMDLLIALNLGVSLLLLMVALYINEPLDFSAFPSVLLMTTLFRLGLTISTSRLILLHADAGDIVYTFGDFAAGGNIVVGMIVFLIITIVNFIVITKGSERVAEVGARFSLDGMPGKQMSIDGDLRAGTIDAGEAKRLRRVVQKESQFYGAMDGAMKFVKGDAIAGLVIIVVNLLGGIGVGVFMRGMSAGDAAAIYAILSIGDGLVSQIPALLISVTAGIIVTRVPGEHRRNLARELTDQLAAQPRSLTLAAVVMLLFGLIPGFPMHYFLLLAALAGSGAWWVGRGQRAAAAAHADPGSTPNANGGRPGAQPLLARVGAGLADPEGGVATLAARIDALRHEKFEQFGVPMPEVAVVVDAALADGTLDIQLYHESVMTLEVMPGEALARHDVSHPIPALRNLAAGAPRETPLPFGGQVLFWLDDAQRDAWRGQGGRGARGRRSRGALRLAGDRRARGGLSGRAGGALSDGRHGRSLRRAGQGAATATADQPDGGSAAAPGGRRRLDPRSSAGVRSADRMGAARARSDHADGVCAAESAPPHHAAFSPGRRTHYRMERGPRHRGHGAGGGEANVVGVVRRSEPRADRRDSGSARRCDAGA